MTWHLKDRELEKVFETYSGGKFVDALNYAVKTENIDSEFIVYVEFGREFLGDDIAENCLCFRTNELEEVPEYNPNDWNNFPEIIPPFDSIMRLEFEDGTTGRKFYYAAFYTSNSWRSAVENGLPEFVLTDGMIESGLIKNVRFRPWED